MAVRWEGLQCGTKQTLSPLIGMIVQLGLKPSRTFH